VVRAELLVAKERGNRIRISIGNNTRLGERIFDEVHG
jgi:hypothetical protein